MAIVKPTDTWGNSKPKGTLVDAYDNLTPEEKRLTISLVALSSVAREREERERYGDYKRHGLELRAPRGLR